MQSHMKITMKLEISCLHSVTLQIGFALFRENFEWIANGCETILKWSAQQRNIGIHFFLCQAASEVLSSDQITIYHQNMKSHVNSWVALYGTQPEAKLAIRVTQIVKEWSISNFPYCLTSIIYHYTVWGTWLFIPYSNKIWLYYQFSLPH